LEIKVLKIDFIKAVRLTGVWVFCAIVLEGCTKDIPAINCTDPDVSSCYVKHALDSLSVVRDNINIWPSILLVGQVLVFIFGLLATIMIALQGDENRYWTRPIGLISTALVTGLTSALVSFHVTANIDKLIDIYSNITTSTNTLEVNLASLFSEQTSDQIQDKFKNDKTYEAEYWKILAPYASSFNKSRVDALKLYGSAGQINSIKAPPDEK
jgi:hypothetical protein